MNDIIDLAVWEQALLKAGENTCDWADKTYLEPILSCIGMK